MKLKKYHKIPQFNSVVRDVSARSSYVGKDDSGESIYDSTRSKPKIKFKGSVKLHGTNAGIHYDVESKELRSFKRNGWCGKDGHHGFPKYVEYYKNEFIDLLDSIGTYYYKYGQKLKEIIIHGEWAGKGVQKGVAISELDKAFYIFDIKVIDSDDNESYMDLDDINQTIFIHNDVHEIPRCHVINLITFTKEIIIDFENPSLSVPELERLTLEVEECCPVAKQFGVEGIGEGIVWTGYGPTGDRYIFKVKGQKHSVTKIKTLAPVDLEKLNSVNAFVDYCVTENRVRQGMEYTQAIDMTGTKDLIRWVINDIRDEETDTLNANGLTMKDVGSALSRRIVQLFKKELNHV